jgi:hypothetical protein
VVCQGVFEKFFQKFFQALQGGRLCLLACVVVLRPLPLDIIIISQMREKSNSQTAQR